MLTHRLIILFVLISFIDASPIDQTIQRYKRSLDLMNWQSAHILFQQLYLNKNPPTQIDVRTRRSEFRPVEGPINIEQLPAMLEARNVKRYPYSQQNDPAVIGR